ncbi:MAG: SDR family oxidoreductase [Chloroflexi bacterium]|nr:SDR family oxidoreductase [Chloroflexota bacterium]
MADLQGKVAIVTGAARHRGIGRGIALRLARDGADVVAVGSPRPPERFPDNEKAIRWRGAASVQEEIAAMGRRSLGLDVDLTQPAGAERIVDQTLQTLGRIDIVVNNAGLGIAGRQNMWEIADEEWYRVVDVNLNAVYLLTSRALRSMTAREGGGRIINISSAAGRMGIPQYGAYCATKWGMVGLTQMLAVECAPHAITVNAIAPGSVDTDMMDGTFQHMAERFGANYEGIKSAVLRSILLGRQGRPEDIAAAVAFFASDDASWITGQTLNVTGGTPMD